MNEVETEDEVFLDEDTKVLNRIRAKNRKKVSIEDLNRRDFTEREMEELFGQV